MGYKTHRARAFAGSMKKFWLQHVKQLHFEVNFSDQYGHKIAVNQIKGIPYINPDLLNTEFTFTYDMMEVPDTETYMRLLFINDFKYVYNLNRMTWAMVQDHMKIMNHYVELDLALKGREFEYPDEIVEIK